MSKLPKAWWQRYPWSALLSNKPKKFPELDFNAEQIKKTLRQQRERRTVRVKSKLP
jgi:hypothetical protein